MEKDIEDFAVGTVVEVTYETNWRSQEESFTGTIVDEPSYSNRVGQDDSLDLDVDTGVWRIVPLQNNGQHVLKALDANTRRRDHQKGTVLDIQEVSA